MTSTMLHAAVAFDASAIGDPDGTRTVIAIVALLVVMGLALIMVAFWMRRVTRPDPEYLAPLELMGERSWRNGDPVWQRRKLDEVRPEDAVPLKRSTAPPRLDESFDVGPPATGFDDLRGDDGPDPSGDVAVDVEAAAPSRATTPPELAGADGESDRPPTAAEWPPRTPDVGDALGSRADDRDPEEDAAVVAGAGNDAGDGDADAGVVGKDRGTGADDVAGERDDGGEADGGEADDGEAAADPTPPIASKRPPDDLSDREIDPDELQRAMAELDEEPRRGGDE